MLNFRKAQPLEKELIASLIKDTVRGVIAFSFLESGGDFCDSFLLGEENGEIKSIIFDSGNEYYLVYGEEFPSLLLPCEMTIMLYTEDSCADENVSVLEGKEIQDIYKLMSESNSLSFDDERRYVLRLRASNSGFARVFGIKRENELISTASVSSENEKYILIADVFTKKEERRLGLAARCLAAAVKYSLGKGKIPVLLCEEKMCDYYKKAGFTVYGKV